MSDSEQARPTMNRPALEQDLDHEVATAAGDVAVPVHGRALLREVLRGDGELGRRLQRLRKFSSRVRSAEYHITNACNLRCHGCWFFAHEYDQRTRELGNSSQWCAFARAQAQDRVTSALLIGGEPTLHLERVRAFVEAMPFVTISTNGLIPLPQQGFDRVAVAITLFGGGQRDDELRGIRPNGKRIQGLFERALQNYRDDPRATFVYALSSLTLDAIEPTVESIGNNGNRVTFNYYTDYSSPGVNQAEREGMLLKVALEVARRHPGVVVSHPTFIRTLITGRSHWGQFGYAVCPSISVDHPAHSARLANGNPVLPGFNAWAADGSTLNYCCTSGHCEGCRDSQAVYSWLLANMARFLGSKEQLEEWLDLAESYWSQFIWSPYHARRTDFCAIG